MSKKDFIALADRLRGLRVPKPVLEATMDYCQDRNPRFNRQRWLDYLRGEPGPGGGKVRK